MRGLDGPIPLVQSHYIDKVLPKYFHLGIKEANTPYDSSSKLAENFGRVIAQIEYAGVIAT